MPTWNNLLALVAQTLTARGSGPTYRDDDALGRRPWVLGALLSPAGWNRDMVTELPPEFTAPDLSAGQLYHLFEEFCQRDLPKYAERPGGKGGRMLRGPANDPSGIVYQLGEGLPDYDGGLYDDLVAHLEDLNQRFDAEGRESLTAQERLWRGLANVFVDWYGSEKQRLSDNGLVDVTHIHVPVYIRPAEMTDIHRDTRLIDPRSRRAVYGCVGAPADEARLTFFVGEDANEGGQGRHARLDLSTAYCYGQAGGNVLMTAQGAGGWCIVPAGWTVSGRCVWLWHVPYSRRWERAILDAGEEVGMRASIALSGFVPSP